MSKDHDDEIQGKDQNHVYNAIHLTKKDIERIQKLDKLMKDGQVIVSDLAIHFQIDVSDFISWILSLPIKKYPFSTRKNNLVLDRNIFKEFKKIK